MKLFFVSLTLGNCWMLPSVFKIICCINRYNNFANKVLYKMKNETSETSCAHALELQQRYLGDNRAMNAYVLYPSCFCEIWALSVSWYIKSFPYGKPRSSIPIHLRLVNLPSLKQCVDDCLFHVSVSCTIFFVLLTSYFNKVFQYYNLQLSLKASYLHLKKQSNLSLLAWLI